MQEFSMLDAFKALKDVSDDIIYSTPKRAGKIGIKKRSTGTLNEAITVDLNSAITPEEGAEVIKAATEKVERPITIVDVNADTLEHVKNNIDYVGQVILKCTKCQGLKFIDMDKLVSTEIEDPDQEDNSLEIYNLEDECPVCHAEHAGFELVGQVNVMPEETSEDKNMVVNDQTPPAEETAQLEVEDDTAEVSTDSDDTADNVDTKEEEISTFDDTDEEEDFFETSAEDDTEDLDLPSIFTDEEDPDQAEEDDTETNESLADGSIRGLLDGTNEESARIIPEEEEVFDFEKPLIIDDSEDATVSDYVSKNRDSAKACGKLKEFFSYIIDPEDTEICEIYSEDAEPKLLYQGTCEDIPETFKNGTLGNFDTAGSLLLINVGDVENGETISEFLDNYADYDSDVIHVTDQESGEELAFGNKQSIIDMLGDKKIISIEAPKALTLYVTPDTKVAEIVREISPKDKLLGEILKANNLNQYNVSDSRTVESWINEALINQEHEDLDNVYAAFIRPTHNKSLIESYKKFTGYRDALDIIQEEFSDLLESPELVETKAKNDSEEDAQKYAQELLKEHPDVKAVIYGYTNRAGKFFAIDPVMCKTSEEYAEASRRVELQYKAFVVRTVFGNGPFLEELDEASEPEGIKKIKRMMSTEAKTESLEESKENFVDRMLKRISQAIDKEDLSFILDDIEAAFKAEAINEDEYFILKAKATDMEKDLLEEVVEIVDDEIVDETLHDWSREDEEAEKRTIDRDAEKSIAIEEVKKWADRDKDSEKIFPDLESFEKACIDAGIDSDFVDELYDYYLDKVGYFEECLTEAVDESHYLDFKDEILIRINGEEVFKGTVEDTFKDEQALEEFHNKFRFEDGKYKAEEDNEEWEVEVTKKAEVTEQLEKTSDSNETEEICEKCGKAISECDCSENIEGIESYKTRRELGEAIEKCKAANKRFKVSKSLTEGYRYDLMILDDVAENPDDWKADDLDLGAEEYEAEKQAEKEIEATQEAEDVQAAIDAEEQESGIPSDEDAPEEFDTDYFDAEVNAYFKEAYTTEVIYKTKTGSIDKHGNLLLEGTLTGNNSNLDIKFYLEPNKKLEESANKKDITYRVTNNLSDEQFEFGFDC